VDGVWNARERRRPAGLAGGAASARNRALPRSVRHGRGSQNTTRCPYRTCVSALPLRCSSASRNCSVLASQPRRAGSLSRRWVSEQGRQGCARRNSSVSLARSCACRRPSPSSRAWQQPWLGKAPATGRDLHHVPSTGLREEAPQWVNCPLLLKGEASDATAAAERALKLVSREAPDAERERRRTGGGE
jgi:hypothetical protein